MDNMLPLTTCHIQPEVPNNNTVQLYTMDASLNEKKTLPFIHTVRLMSETGALMNIRGGFNNRAMVNSLCKSMYKPLEDKLGKLTTSWHQL